MQQGSISPKAKMAEDNDSTTPNKRPKLSSTTNSSIKQQPPLGQTIWESPADFALQLLTTAAMAADKEQTQHANGEMELALQTLKNMGLLPSHFTSLNVAAPPQRSDAEQSLEIPTPPASSMRPPPAAEPEKPTSKPQGESSQGPDIAQPEKKSPPSPPARSVPAAVINPDAGMDLAPGDQDPLFVFSSLLTDMQQRLGPLEAISYHSDQRLVNLENAAIASQRAMNGMVSEWRELVAKIQLTVRELTVEIVNRNKLFGVMAHRISQVEAEASRARSENRVLRQQVESLNAMMGSLIKMVGGEKKAEDR